jgi:beta-glucosidase
VPRGWTPLPHLPQSPRMASPWLYVGPEVAYWGVRTVSELWKPKSIFISENGCSADDVLDAQGRDDDADRIMYLRNYLGQFQRATAEDYPLHGYFLWSLMDNFEWVFGLEKRFGLYHVDFNSQRRTPKLSASFYRNVIARNAAGA